jgi:hypothetical protein
MTTQIDIRPTEIDGKHYVVVIMDGHEMKQHGPFPDADAAEAMAVVRARAAAASAYLSGG